MHTRNAEKSGDFSQRNRISDNVYSLGMDYNRVQRHEHIFNLRTIARLETQESPPDRTIGFDDERHGVRNVSVFFVLGVIDSIEVDDL